MRINYNLGEMIDLYLQWMELQHKKILEILREEINQT